MSETQTHELNYFDLPFKVVEKIKKVLEQDIHQNHRNEVYFYRCLVIYLACSSYTIIKQNVEAKYPYDFPYGNVTMPGDVYKKIEHLLPVDDENDTIEGAVDVTTTMQFKNVEKISIREIIEIIRARQ